MNTLLEDFHDGIVNGAAVLAEAHGNPLFAASIGFADNARRHPMALDTVIDIASVTKMVTAITSLLICHSRGLVDFDAPFTEYLPDFTAPLKAPIRVRDLANHTSGFGDVPGQRQRLYFDEDGLQMLRNIMVTPPPYPPTPHANYACWNYLLLAKIIEHITQAPLTGFCSQEIFQPLGMTDTALGTPPPHIPVERLAQTFNTARPGEISDFVACRIFTAGGTTANAGAFSTANDLAKLLRCYLHHGQLENGQRLFDEKAFAEIAPDKASHVDGYRRFGWVIYDSHMSEDMFGTSLLHSGWSGQTILFDTSKDFLGIVLTTRSGDYERCKVTRFQVLSRLFHAI